MATNTIIKGLMPLINPNASIHIFKEIKVSFQIAHNDMTISLIKSIPVEDIVGQGTNPLIETVRELVTQTLDEVLEKVDESVLLQCQDLQLNVHGVRENTGTRILASTEMVVGKTRHGLIAVCGFSQEA